MIAAPSISKRFDVSHTASHDPIIDEPGRRPRYRVLVGAYTLSPVRGSEPGMGWNICRALAAHHDLTVLCAPGMPGANHSVYRQEIQKYFDDHGPVPGLTIQYVEPPIWSRMWQRERELFRRTMYYSGYASWQRAAYRAAVALHRERPFDLVHQLNMTGYREPGYLWKLDAPFVWGPVGGAANIPAEFFPLMGTMDRVFYRLRNIANEWQKRRGRRCRAAARRASTIWAIGEENRVMAQQYWGRDAVALLESGTKPSADQRLRAFDGCRPLRLVWSGLHIGRKALPILLQALARLSESGGPPIELVVLGGGPETARWRALAEQFGIAPFVRWSGQVPQGQALAEVSRADALIFTSLQEGTPHAVLEAMSLGLPIVCHEACGMGVAVTETCGIKIPLIDPATSVTSFARAIRQLAEKPGELERLSAGALRRSQELRWENLAATLARGYEKSLSIRRGA